MHAVAEWCGTAQFDIEPIETHRRDHLLAIARDRTGRSYFVKAFAASDEHGFRNEVDVHTHFAGRRLTPRLRYVDSTARVLVTDLGPPFRLSQLDSDDLLTHLCLVPDLYARSMGGPAASPSPITTEEFGRHYARVADRPGCAGLPGAEEIVAILRSRPHVPVHGDFQPSNILTDGQGTVVVIDFESYGRGLPAIDVARTALNPLLDLTYEQRHLFAQRMLEAIEAGGYPPIDPLGYAAACAYWAVCCTAYFSGIIAADPAVIAVSPEVAVLATEPLEICAELWKRAM